MGEDSTGQLKATVYVDLEEFSEKLADAMEKMKKEVVPLLKEQLAIDCVVQNIKVFLEQSKEERRADFGEPCEHCKYADNCNFDWLSIMKPILEKSNVKINLGDQVQRGTQDSVHKDPDLGKSICHKD